jgi:hypothetical protein
LGYKITAIILLANKQHKKWIPMEKSVEEAETPLEEEHAAWDNTAEIWPISR